ncbi:hypothetical protein AURDEDRAFT_140523 [Auricularia subglabra TFB-10046 SS5]|uniref:F-box domain-containing protein n=1 Tax=Auricularia subglabra (strain TFB-10046 / SS5) TaxID=717982 RepID=J0CW63_AURST|nr:hypothetical protein AURDEDRAFT_140523 [Auricularia subglabra TFB-10046 SS5]
MPLLRVLTIAVVRSAGSRWLLFPRAVSTGGHRPLLGLQRVTISDLPVEDMIMSQLSTELTELSLRDMPRYYSRRRDPSLYNSPIALAHHVSTTLRASPTTMLRRLELVFRDDGTESQLLALIGNVCPNLVFLELHRYARDDLEFMNLDISVVDIPCDSIAALLSPLRRLRILRLNYDLGLHLTEGHYTPGLYSMWIPRSSAHRWRPFLEQQAHRLAEVLPRLKTVSLLSMDEIMRPRWMSWTGGVMEPINLSDLWNVDYDFF